MDCEPPGLFAPLPEFDYHPMRRLCSDCNQIDEDSISAGSGGGGEEEGESVMDEGEEMSELGSVGKESVDEGSVGEDSLNSFGENVGVGGLSAGPSTTPPLPKPRGRAPKGKVWDEVVGWVDDPAAAEEAEAEESGDAKRAKLAEPLTKS